MRRRKENKKLCTFLEDIEEDKYNDDEEEMEEASFSRKHYQAIADILAQHAEGDSTEAVSEIAGDIADLFAQDNPRFDREKFLSAAGVPMESYNGADEKEIEEEGDEEEAPEEETPEDAEEVDEAVADVGSMGKVLKALGSNPADGLEDLLTIVGSNLVKVLGIDKKDKIETALEKMKREALQRGNPLAREEKDDEEELSTEE